MFEYYGKSPEHAARFAEAMAGVTINLPPPPPPPVDRNPSSTLGDFFPWDTLRGTVVDVRGGSGHVSIALARRFPHLSFRVQDSEKMLSQGRRVLAKEDPAVASRRNPAATLSRPLPPPRLPQLGRRRLHGHPPRARCCRAWVTGTPLHEERAMRRQDIMMLVGLGPKERTRAGWEALFRAPDERLELKRVHGQGQSALLGVVPRK
ncbi:hypothetical protein BBP40_003154 [Aspergillus hancockii]|nr:hypothetical protein BBP40_003154 [Aspergillus hancockii]